MATISETLATAIEHHQAGRLETAQRIYRKILDLDPCQADATHLLGVLALQTGQYQQAIEYITKAIAFDGTRAIFHSNLGEAYRA